MKKLLALALAALLMCSMAACDTGIGPNPTEAPPQDTNPSASVPQSGENQTPDTIDFSQIVKIVGFKIGCPSNADVWDTDYGMSFWYQSKIAVLIEAPSTAGIMLDNTKLEDAAIVSKEYVIKSLETTVQDKFDFGSTEQTITKSEVKTINGIEVLRVEGVFKNTMQDTTIEFVGYYFLSKTRPVYIVGIPRKEDVSVAPLIDGMAHTITR